MLFHSEYFLIIYERFRRGVLEVYSKLPSTCLMARKSIVTEAILFILVHYQRPGFRDFSYVPSGLKNITVITSP